MLFELLHEHLRLFHYLTFRSFLALVSAFTICLALGPWFIRTIREFEFLQEIREEGPEHHKVKAGTPTMGGILIAFGTLVPTLLWADLTNAFVQTAVLASILFAVIGGVDDSLKITRRNNQGLTSRQKFGLQVAGTLGLFVFVWFQFPFITVFTLPFFKSVHLEMGVLYAVVFLLVVVGSSNAVNLTDGLDGLAIGSTLVAATTFSVFAYMAGNKIAANYLQIAYIPGGGELAVFFAALVGSALGFLWFNAHPAEIFMGDVGSLMIGGAIGTAECILKMEIVLFFVGGLFVMEALSVIIQVASYKSRGKRVFKMAPLHHHFEKSGWSETKVVIRFWIIAILCALAGLATLKLR
jgi:phospho-N-acetylmuramoyl-pentapeptide-transferase